MPVYAKLVNPNSLVFRNRVSSITSVGRGIRETIYTPVPDNIVLCDGCNHNMTETPEAPLYMVYLGKHELKEDRPHDSYCEPCLRRYFPKAIKVGV